MKKNEKKVRETTKKITLPKFSLIWPKRNEELKPTLNTTRITLSGIFLTCIVLSIVSGFIDLTFFSGLSKSHYAFFGFAKGIPAGILFSMMSIGFILGKFFCAMMLGALNELQTRLKNAGYAWYKNINKAKFKWHIAHKFIITISLITSISLSVVSIGDAIRKNQNVIKRANEDIQKITKYANTTDTSDDVQFSALIKGTAASSTAATRAADQAAKIWPIIEEYRSERSNFPVAFDSKEEIEWEGRTIIPDDYWTERNNKVVRDVSVYRTMTLYQIRNITSESQLATTIKTEIENSVANNSLDELTELAGKTKEKAVQEIKNLEGRYYMPGSDVAVVFDPDNISGSLNLLSDIKAAYENDTGDIGESSKLFMLIGPQIDDLRKVKTNDIEEVFDQKVSVSSFGTTEVMMMILIMIFGIVQEFLIALFTPKATISREILYRYDACFGEDFDIDRFLLGVYRDYKKKGVLTKSQYEALAKECVEEMEESIEDDIHKYSKKYQAQLREEKKQKKDTDSQLEELKKYYEAKIKDLADQTPIEPAPRIEVSHGLSEDEIDVGLEAASKAIKQTEQEIEQAPIEDNESLPPKVSEVPISQQIDSMKEYIEKLPDPHANDRANLVASSVGVNGYSEKVDEAINEIESILKD